MPLVTKLHPPPTQTPIHLPTPATPYPPTNPTTLNDALTVRYKVFVEEQGCAAENEVDGDDGASWHWVVYNFPEGSVHRGGSNGDGGENGGERGNGESIGVIRLVPPTATAHHPDNHANTTADTNANTSGNVEPHIRLTRLAVPPPHRGQGIAHHLVQTALTWAAHNPGPINGNGGDQTQTSTGPVGGWSGLVLVHAQVAVEGMYQRLGFVRDEAMGRWEEEGIEHVGMWRRVQVST